MGDLATVREGGKGGRKGGKEGHGWLEVHDLCNKRGRRRKEDKDHH